MSLAAFRMPTRHPEPLADVREIPQLFSICKYPGTPCNFCCPHRRVFYVLGVETFDKSFSHSSVSHDVKCIHPVQAMPQVCGKVDLKMVLTANNFLPGPNLQALTKAFFRPFIQTEQNTIPVRRDSQEDSREQKHYSGTT